MHLHYSPNPTLAKRPMDEREPCDHLTALSDHLRGQRGEFEPQHPLTRTTWNAARWTLAHLPPFDPPLADCN